jgi:hypothetical protein
MFFQPLIMSIPTVMGYGHLGYSILIILAIIQMRDQTLQPGHTFFTLLCLEELGWEFMLEGRINRMLVEIQAHCIARMDVLGQQRQQLLLFAPPIMPILFNISPLSRSLVRGRR